MSKHFTTKEAAERLHIHPDTLRRWVKEGGRFSHLDLKETAGGHKRYSEDDLEKMGSEIMNTTMQVEGSNSPSMIETPQNAQAYSCDMCEGSGEKGEYVCTKCRGTGTYWIRRHKRAVSKNEFIQRWKENGRVDDALGFSILAPIAGSAMTGFLILGIGLAVGGEGEPTEAFINFFAGIMYLFLAFLAICGLMFIYGVISKIVFYLDHLFSNKEVDVLQRGEQIGSEISWVDIQ